MDILLSGALFDRHSFGNSLVHKKSAADHGGGFFVQAQQGHDDRHDPGRPDQVAPNFHPRGSIFMISGADQE